jgi:hypothetical protein
LLSVSRAHCFKKPAAEAIKTIASEMDRAHIEMLKHNISRPEQFAINFDYLTRRVSPP